jgi:plasmid maintenance system killer protein
MEILFIDNRLERFCDGEYTLKLSKDIQNSLQKKVSIIDSAEDLQTLYAIRGLNFERL